MRSLARLSPLLAWTALACMAPWCASCGGRDRPDVVLVVLDTVRADHVSCYGAAHETTPNLDALAARADRHALARSTAPWTLPSHASLFTGRMTFEHGADARRTGEWIEDAVPLPPEETTLAEVLSAAGYRTGAFVANVVYVSRRLGLDQGFEEFRTENLSGPALSAAALEWLGRVEPDEPVFLFLNYMDAHRPYNSGPLGASREADLPAPALEGESSEELLDRLCQQVLEEGSEPDPALVQSVQDAYDRGIAHADAGLGVLLEGLRRHDRFEDALIIVCSDHGEYFGEHALVEHSKDLYEPALRVPLIVKRPRQTAGKVLEEPISIADVPGLVLAEMPLSLAGEHAAPFPGVDGPRPRLAEIRYGRPKDLARPWGKRFLRERTAYYSGRYKLIRSSDGRHELYDLEADPAELHDLFAEQPGDAGALMEELERLQANAGARARAAPAEEPAPEEREALEALGYVDGRVESDR